MTVGLVTDSTAAVHGLDPATGWRIVPLEIEIDGTRYREDPELSTGEFHHMVHLAHTPPVTIPPPPAAFAEAYRELLARHERVLSVHISGELSATVENARAAAAELEAGERVAVFDSRLAGAAVGLLCLEADARLAAGETLDEVVRALEAVVAAARVYFSVYTLDFLYLGGRLERQPRTGAPNVEDRPILALEAGRLELLERVIGETTRVERILELLEMEFGGSRALVAAVTHAGSRGEEAAARLEQGLAGGRRGSLRCRRAPLGPVLCAHTGFDVCGVAVYPRDLSRLADA